MIVVSAQRNTHRVRITLLYKVFEVIVLYLVGHMINSLSNAKALFDADYTENMMLRSHTLSLGFRIKNLGVLGLRFMKSKIMQDTSIV